MTETAPSRLWIIRHQDQGKPEVVAKFDTAGETRIPDEITGHDNFQILEVSGRSGLADQEIDHSVLSDSERAMLRQVYRVQS